MTESLGFYAVALWRSPLAFPFVLLGIGLPFWLWFGVPRSKLGAYARFFFAAGVVVALEWLIAWDRFSLLLRPFLLALLVAGTGRLISRARRVPTWPARVQSVLPTVLLGFAGLAAAGAMAVERVEAGTYSEGPVHLDFPFENGVYAIAQGGNGQAALINYHFTGGNGQVNPGMGRLAKFAVDITKLNGAGSYGIPWSRSLSDFPSFGAPIRSPCEGRVISEMDAAADLSEPGPGNYIQIRCVEGERTFILTLAHLRSGSIVVPNGSRVAKGQAIAEAGNAGSGRDLIPALHIQANLEEPSAPWGGLGESLPMLFEGRFPVTNEIFRR